MSILTDIPPRQRFEDSNERGAFSRWMKYSIVFAALACAAAIMIVYFVDSSRSAQPKTTEKEPDKLPVVADLPNKAKSSTENAKTPTKSTGTKTTKKTSSASSSKTSPGKSTKTH